MKLIRIIFLIAFVGAQPVFAETVPSADVADPVTDIESVKQEIQILESKGKYLEAQKLYGDLLQLKNLSTGDQQTLQKASEALNLKLLFSRNEMPGSEVYTVQSGDTLYGIAKKYKTTIELIQKINGISGDKIYPGMKLKVVKDPFTLLVDISDNRLILYLKDWKIKEYPVATGKLDSSPTPTGEFAIKTKLENPTWYHAGAVVPPDSPDNILGTRWMGFDHQGYGIHGTTQPETVGKSVSAGCIRMLNEDVEELYNIVPYGTAVTIVE